MAHDAGERRRFALSALVALGILAGFSIWASVDPVSLRVAADEDHWIENITAALFLCSGGCFLLFAFSSRFLRERGSRWAYFFPLAWAFLMLFFAGEEMSWGQRVAGFETPEWVADGNLQNEFNVHNFGPLDVILGGKYRMLSVMMLLTGLGIPLFARTRVGLRLIRHFAFPVCPLAYGVFFVGAYVFGKVWDPSIGNDAAEIREFTMSMGMALFGAHGAARPPDLFLLERSPISAPAEDATPRAG